MSAGKKMDVSWQRRPLRPRGNFHAALRRPCMGNRIRSTSLLVPEAEKIATSV